MHARDCTNNIGDPKKLNIKGQMVRSHKLKPKHNMALILKSGREEKVATRGNDQIMPEAK